MRDQTPTSNIQRKRSYLNEKMRALCLALIMVAGFSLAIAGLAPSVAADETAPADTVLLQQSLDFTQQELDDNWVPDRTEPTAGWGSVSFEDRTDVLELGIDSSQADDSAFWRTEGIRTEKDVGHVIETDLYVDEAWQGTPVRAGVWAAGYDAAPADGGDRSEGWGIFEFTTAAFNEGADQFEADDRWRVWVSGHNWIDLDADVEYGDWVTLTISLDVDAQEYTFAMDGEDLITVDLPVDDVSWLEPSVTVGEVFYNSFNYGQSDVGPGLTVQDYEAHWHGLDNLRGFEAIQPAIDAASDGDSVLVGPGTYEETLEIVGLNGFSLVGAGSDDVTIDASSASVRSIDVRSGDDLTLEGFTLLGSDDYGIKASHIDGFTVEDVHVSQSGSTGLDLNTVDNAQITDVEATENGGNGIAVRNGASVTLDTVTTDANAWGGLALYAPGTETVDNVLVTGSTFSNEGAGVYLQYDGFTDIQIQDSTFSGNDVGLGLFDNFPGTPEAGSVSVHLSAFDGNDVGVLNDGTGTLDATQNYWNAPTGTLMSDLTIGDGTEGDVDTSEWCVLSDCSVTAPPV